MQSSLEIPKEEYAAALMPKFTGERFDADFIAQLAVDAGARYIVPITKHHEGFCLFDSDATDFKITNTPARRDWIKELAHAGRARGLKVGFYYSQNLDWHHAGAEWTPERYFDELVMPQIGELLSGYGEVSVLWFDIPGGAIDTGRARRLVEMARQLQPGIVINNRLGGDFEGDFQTPEQDIPPAGLPGRDWEACQTLNDTWEYTHYDRNWKSPTTLVRELIDTASKGGNYLVNIGPKPDGTIPQSNIDILRAIGGWMRVHGDSIYGTSASPFPRQLPWGRCTQRSLGDGVTRLYLHIFRWPFDSVLRVPKLANEILAVSLLSEPGAGPLDHGQDTSGDLPVHLPGAEPNDYATVVTLDVKGVPEVVIPPIAPDQSGLLALDADLAVIVPGPVLGEISGLGETATTLCYNSATRTLDAWGNPGDRAFWPVTIARPGTYAVEVTYSCKAGEGGGEYAVEHGEQSMRFTPSATPERDEFRTDAVGVLEIESTKRAEIAIRPLHQTGKNPMKLRALTLMPVHRPTNE